MKFKKLHQDAQLPVQKNPGDAGFDIHAIEDATLHDVVVKVRTGVAVEIPAGHVGLILDRSSVATKQFIQTVAGVIDSSYRGEMQVALTHLGHDEITVKKGDRIAQLVILPCVMEPSEWVEELSETQRGAGGFGSTGR